MKYRKILIIFTILVFLGVVLPKIVIRDSLELDDEMARSAKLEAGINYIDKPIPRILATEMRASFNNQREVIVDVYTYFGIKLVTVEFSEAGNSHAEWNFF